MLTNILKYIISAKLSISFYITNRILDFCIKIFNLFVSFLLTFAIHVSVNRRCRNHHIKTATMSCPVLLQLAHRRLSLQKTSASADLFLLSLGLVCIHRVAVFLLSKCWFSTVATDSLLLAGVRRLYLADRKNCSKHCIHASRF